MVILPRWLRAALVRVFPVLLDSPVPRIPAFAFGSPVLPGLAKLCEESGEVVQVVGKLMMTGGGAQYWDGVNLDDKLLEEISDLQAALEFFVQHNRERISIVAFCERVREKKAKFERWHEEMKQ